MGVMSFFTWCADPRMIMFALLDVAMKRRRLLKDKAYGHNV